MNNLKIDNHQCGHQIQDLMMLIKKCNNNMNNLKIDNHQCGQQDQDLVLICLDQYQIPNKQCHTHHI